jgi:hypothetical protein
MGRAYVVGSDSFRKRCDELDRTDTYAEVVIIEVFVSEKSIRELVLENEIKGRNAGKSIFCLKACLYRVLSSCFISGSWLV